MPLRAIGRLLKWCVTAGWKGFTVLALIFILLGVGYCQCQQKVETDDNTEAKYTVPSIGEARYEVQTVHRLFYADKVTKRGKKEVIIQRYWEQVGGSWHYFEKETLDPKVVGEILIKKR